MNNFLKMSAETLSKEKFFFIAELSSNHNGDFERYKLLVKAAKDAGAHAVKIQTASADSLCLKINKNKHTITDGPWAGQSYWDLYKSLEVPLDWSSKIKDYATSIDIPIFSSPFSPRDVEFLSENNFEMLKVASGELACPQLIDSIINSGLPFMASTGLAGREELDWLENRLRANDASNQLWCLFNCISNYPSHLSELNISKFSLLSHYSSRFGLSDHSLDPYSCLLAFMAGARIFEKHLTLSRSDGGPDSFFSLEPHELKRHIDLLSEAALNPTILSSSLQTTDHASVGHAQINFSRSLYSKVAIQRGDILTLENIGSFRPAHNEPSLYLDHIIGKKSNVDIAAGEPVLLHYIK